MVQVTCQSCGQDLLGQAGGHLSPFILLESHHLDPRWARLINKEDGDRLQRLGFRE